MSNGKNPYEIMGISRSASLVQIKSRYFELARIHHPDKLSSTISDNEKKKHEEKFKDITNAYSKINKEKELEAKFGIGDLNNFDNMSDDLCEEDWRAVWSDLESFFNKTNSWEAMKNIVTDTIKDTLYEATLHSIYQSTNKWKETSKEAAKKQHYINVEVTMEEVHLKKQKKLRLFLKGIKFPVFLTLDIGEFPETVVTHTINDKKVLINFTMELVEHKLFRLDDLLESWDLWLLEPIKITWADYLCGKKISIEYIDYKKIDIFLKPFEFNSPYCIKDKGLCELGDLYIVLELEPPPYINKTKWENLDHKFKTCFLKELYELYS